MGQVEVAADQPLDVDRQGRALDGLPEPMDDLDGGSISLWTSPAVLPLA